MRKDRLDGVGLSALLAVALLLAFNQIIVKEVNQGLQPVFFAGLRSALAVAFVWAFLKWRGLTERLRWSDLRPGLLMGTVFAAEFLCLFMALDLTLVSRASVIFYSMPVWMGLLGHFFLPGERLNGVRAFGLLFSLSGHRLGDLLAARRGGGGQPLGGSLCAGRGLGLGWHGLFGAQNQVARSWARGATLLDGCGFGPDSFGGLANVRPPDPRHPA